MFGADLLPRPAYRDVPHRVVGDLSGSDFVMRNVFWIGLYPDLTEEMLDFSATAILEFARRATHASAAR